MDRDAPKPPTGVPAPETTAIGRRTVLLGGSAALLLAACGDDGDGAGRATSATESAGGVPLDAVGADGASSTSLTAADFDGLGSCRLYPESTSGPFPLDEQFDRQDITEGLSGLPLRLGLQVVGDGCAPVAGAVVEIWHTDATGDYSAFADGGGGKDEAEGTTFFRGSQAATDEGIVEFLTIVPGWYRGRAVHIHVRVHVDDTTVLTGQIYFDPDQLESVYLEPPYAAFGPPDTSNENDGLAGDPAAEGSLVLLTDAETDNGTGRLGLLTLAVDT